MASLGVTGPAGSAALDPFSSTRATFADRPILAVVDHEPRP
jgi:hypothetical protein